MTALLEIKNLSKHFSTNKSVVRAVDDVSLAMSDGENLGLVGESGSGKTTLARMLVRLIRPDAGTIRLAGEDIVHLPRQQTLLFRRNVQMVFQDPYGSLDPRLTIYRILAESFVLERGVSKTQQEQRIVQVLSEVGLKADILARFPHEFSGGERQRVAIARALLMNPRLLILDEAVSSLDVLIQAQIIELLKEIQSRRQVTYLFVTHNLRVVQKLCQRTAVMYSGKIVELAATAEVFKNPIHPYTQRLLAAALEYRAPTEEEELSLAGKSCLVDRGNGHFVID